MSDLQATDVRDLNPANLMKLVQAGYVPIAPDVIVWRQFVQFDLVQQPNPNPPPNSEPME